MVAESPLSPTDETKAQSTPAPQLPHPQGHYTASLSPLVHSSSAPHLPTVSLDSIAEKPPSASALDLPVQNSGFSARFGSEGEAAKDTNNIAEQAKTAMEPSSESDQDEGPAPPSDLPPPELASNLPPPPSDELPDELPPPELAPHDLPPPVDITDDLLPPSPPRDLPPEEAPPATSDLSPEGPQADVPAASLPDVAAAPSSPTGDAASELEHMFDSDEEGKDDEAAPPKESTQEKADADKEVPVFVLEGDD